MNDIVKRNHIEVESFIGFIKDYIHLQRDL